MSKPKASSKAGKPVPTSAQPKAKPKAFDEGEQLALAKALRTKRKQPEPEPTADEVEE